jgi:hypothetical protein
MPRIDSRVSANGGAAAAPRLLLGKCPQQIGAGLFRPVGPRFKEAAGGNRSHLHVRAHHHQAVIALRRLELHVRDLARLHTAGQRDRRAGACNQ